MAGCVALWVAAVTARDGAVADPQALAARITTKFDQPLVRFALVDAESGDPAAPFAGFALTVDRTTEGARVAFLDLLAAHPAAAGRGLGRMLLRDAIEQSRRQGFPTLELQVRDGNERALALYRSAGFRPTGESEPHPLGGAPMLTYRLGLA